MKIDFYGVHHGAQHTVLGIPVAEVNVMPSALLTSSLSGLPKGTRVGIELPEQYVENGKLKNDPLFQIDELGVTMDASNRFYWSKILEICKPRNFDLCFLEDFETEKECVRLDLELRKMREKSGKSETPPSIETMSVEEYRMGTKYDHKLVIERENKILQNILQKQPQVGVIGGGHVEFFIHTRDKLLKEHGLEIGSYAIEVVEHGDMLENVANFGHDVKPTLVLTENKELDYITIFRRESLERRYSAVKTGRILLNQKPDYIGTWYPRIPEYGLFEVYIEKQGPFLGEGSFQQGTIEDTLGSAVFLGKGLAENSPSIRFVKTYNPMVIKAGAAEGEISYEAALENGSYEGTFQNPYANGKFSLKRFA